MKTSLAILLFVVLSNTAMAAWMKFGENEHQSAYYEPASIELDGSIAKVLILNDFNSAWELGDSSALSMVNQFELDCKKKRRRISTMSLFSESMGQGEKVFFKDSPAQWGRANTAGTIEYPSFDLVCEKIKDKKSNNGWVKFAEGKSESIYFDPKSIRRGDGKSTVTILTNFSSAMLLGDKSVLSMINRFEFDCKKQLMRLNTLSMFAESMGQGDKVLSNDNPPNKWNKANEAGTLEYPSIKVVCGN